MSAPFWGKAVVIGRSSGPPGRRSLTIVSANAGAEASARVAAPAPPRNCRRHESEREKNAFSLAMAASPTQCHVSSNLSYRADPDFSKNAVNGLVLPPNGGFALPPTLGIGQIASMPQ